VIQERWSKAELDQLVLEARAGSRTARDRLLEAIADCLRKENAVRGKPRILSPSRTLSDVVQETILKVHMTFGRCRANGFRGVYRWVRGIHVNSEAAIVRKSRRRNTDDRREAIGRAIRQRINFDPDRGESLCDALATKVDGARAYQHYLRLPKHDQVIIALRLFEGLTFPEIGTDLGRSEGAARKAFDRAILKLTDMYVFDGAP
jgi:RNA polymerase sigma factor (sigma-70 family)